MRVDSRANAHRETPPEALIHRLYGGAGRSSFRLFQSCPWMTARTLLGHTLDGAAGAKLVPMIEFDQILIVMVSCYLAVHLLVAG